jgi:hypothetical protein
MERLISEVQQKKNFTKYFLSLHISCTKLSQFFVKNCAQREDRLFKHLRAIENVTVTSILQNDLHIVGYTSTPPFILNTIVQNDYTGCSYES